jgi:hypothetical protein
VRTELQLRNRVNYGPIGEKAVGGPWIRCKVVNVVTRNSHFSDGEKTRAMRNAKGADGNGRLGSRESGLASCPCCFGLSASRIAKQPGPTMKKGTFSGRSIVVVSSKLDVG